jgi:hypothetical protein
MGSALTTKCFLLESRYVTNTQMPNENELSVACFRNRLGHDLRKVRLWTPRQLPQKKL